MFRNTSLRLPATALTILLFTTGGCGPSRPSLPFEALDPTGLPEQITALATGDVDGDGFPDLISGDGQWYRTESSEIGYNPGLLRIDGWTGSGFQALYSDSLPAPLVLAEVADVTGDGKPEVIAGLGWQTYVDGAAVHLRVLSNDGISWQMEEPLLIPTPRSQVTDLQTVDLDRDGTLDIQFSYFTSKYYVETKQLFRRSGSWEVKTLPEVRMAMSRLAYSRSPDEPAVQIVGRVYGDELGDLGDLFMETGGEERKTLPSWQGVNALASADIDGDGLAELLVSDGWHMNYGRLARARLAILHPDPDGLRYDLVEDVVGQHSLSRISVADITGSRAPEIVASGNMSFRIWGQAGTEFVAFTPEGINAAPFALADLTGDRRAELITAGAPPAVYTFSKRLPWSDELGEEVIPVDLEPEDLIERPAPGIVIEEWLNSDPISLDDLQGKVVVLDFWATWCVPCREMYPVLSEWHKTMSEDGLVVIGITRYDERQRDLEVVKSFVENEGLDYPIAISRGNLTHIRYGVGPIPHTVVIGPDGVVRYSVVGAGEPRDAENLIKRLLFEPQRADRVLF